MADWAKIVGWGTTIGPCVYGGWKTIRTGGLSNFLNPRQTVIKAVVGCAAGIAFDELFEDTDPSCYSSQAHANYARDAATAARMLQQQILKTLPTRSSVSCTSVWPIDNREISIKEFNRYGAYLVRCQQHVGSNPSTSILYFIDPHTTSYQRLADGNGVNRYPNAPLMQKAANGECTPVATH